MRNILYLLITPCFFLLSFTKSSSAASHAASNAIANSTVQWQKEIVLGNYPQRKMNLKERLVLKWYKKKNSRSISEDEQKKKIILLGKLSLWGAIAAIVFVFVPLGFFLSVLLIPTSLILGIMSLNRRKKLEDKSGVSKWPAIIGIIISSLAILIVGLFLLTYAISGGG